ncbi:hypothetical protein PISL3812_05183 [Talaromyces islandicus]|uniref:AB hydrolase-1 domain-containing protein n=1 Tax=Talaromyces islandicus TaxID=28573 RepID=A0A0U1LZ46_TALIS|nr:hypothetical protein PISL3812_05183 [Talaromyces islandicus]
MSNPWEQEPCKSGLVSLGPNHALHLSVSGPARQPGQPLVVIIPGLGASAAEWVAVNRLATQFSRVLLYDRSGYGLSSETTTSPITAVGIASELDSLLRAVELSGPFVIVCHSWGGIIGREFLHLRPDDVAGIVFVDANQELNTTEDPWPSPFVRSLARGLDFLEVTGTTQNHKLLPDEWQAYLDEEHSVKHERVAAAEAAGYRDSGPVLAQKKQLQARPPLLGDRPISVLKGRAERDFEKVYEAGIKAGNGTEEERAQFREAFKTYGALTEAWQRETMKLSNNSRWGFAEKSGHNVQFTEPEVIVEDLQWVLSHLVLN